MNCIEKILSIKNIPCPTPNVESRNENPAFSLLGNFTSSIEYSSLKFKNCMSYFLTVPMLNLCSYDPTR